MSPIINPVLAMQAFGFSASAGIVATGAIQLALFGSVTACGAAILAVRAVRRLYLNALAAGAAPPA